MHIDGALEEIFVCGVLDDLLFQRLIHLDVKRPLLATYMRKRHEIERVLAPWRLPDLHIVVEKLFALFLCQYFRNLIVRRICEIFIRL